MRLVCEDVVSDILPAVRSLIAKELQEKGYSQTEIAELLDITQPAVSQYLNAARGKKVQTIEQDQDCYERVEELVDALLDDKPGEELEREFCDTCLTIRESGVLGGREAERSTCGLHQRRS